MANLSHIEFFLEVNQNINLSRLSYGAKTMGLSIFLIMSSLLI